MTVLIQSVFKVVKEYRHFDQVKRIEKSPEAKQYYTTTLVLFALLSIDFAFLLYSFYLSPAVFYHIYSTHLISSQRSSLLDSFIRFTLQRLPFSLHSFYPCSLQRIAPFPLLTHTTHNPSSLSTPHFSLPIIFITFIFIYRCYNMLYRGINHKA